MPVRGSPRTGGDGGPARDAVASGAGGATPSAHLAAGGGAIQGSVRGTAASSSPLPSSPAPLTHMPTPVPAAMLGAPAGVDILAAPSPGTPSRGSSPLTPPTTLSSPIAGVAGAGKKGKGRAVERRVLPARIRRAAGRSEGIRELEEMVVDWLERYADINTTPPESLQITLSTLPLALVTPRPVIAGEPESVLASSVDAPPAPAARPTAQTQPEAGPSRPRIETPSFVFVKQGADDEEEAREELASARARMPRSPAKRLRHGIVGTDHGEDTSDAYYEQQHRKFEVFERRQRIREREKLSFERYKMRARVDLLRSLPDHQWAGVVASVLSRTEPSGWERGRAKLAAEGVDWLRRRLIREGKDLLARYDQLLPSATTTTTTAAPDAKKPRVSLGAESSRPSTPSAPSAASSASPPPRPAPRNRDELPPPSSRRGRGRGSLRGQPSTRSTPPPSRKRTRSQHTHGTTDDDDQHQHDIHEHTDPSHDSDSDSSSALSDPPSPPPDPAKKITLKLNLPRARARESASASASPAPRPPDAAARVRAAPTRSSPRTAVPPSVPPPPQARSSPRTTVTPAAQPLPQAPPTPPPPRVHKRVLVQTKLSFAVAARPAQPAMPAGLPHAQEQPAAPPPVLERLEAQPPVPPVERVDAQPPVPLAKSLPARTLGSPPKALRPQRQQARPPSPRVVVTPQPGGSILLEAARKREQGLLEPGKLSPVSNGTPDRRGGRPMQSRPFGMPLPASVERASEFMLSDDEFLPIMAERKRAAGTAARRSLSHTESTGTSAGSGNTAPATTDEDVLDMEGVEEAVVL